MISMALRLGASVEMVVQQLRGITCCPAWDNGVQVMSVPDGVARVLERHIVGGTNDQNLSGGPVLQAG